MVHDCPQAGPTRPQDYEGDGSETVGTKKMANRFVMDKARGTCPYSTRKRQDEQERHVFACCDSIDSNRAKPPDGSVLLATPCGSAFRDNVMDVRSYEQM